MYRAADTPYGGPGACYARSIEDARAYQVPGIGYGGPIIYRATLSPDARVLDVAHIGTRGLAPYYGGSDGLRDRLDRTPGGYDYEIVEADPQPLLDAGYTHVEYIDTYPEGCVTVQRIAPGSDVLVEVERWAPPTYRLRRGGAGEPVARLITADELDAGLDPDELEALGLYVEDEDEDVHVLDEAGTVVGYVNTWSGEFEPARGCD